MSNIGSSFLLLAIALLLLWLAVTDKLSNVLDAWDVATGKAKVGNATSTIGNTVAAATGMTQQLHLPALPSIGTMANVSI